MNGMATLAAVTVNGRTVQEILAVSSAELAASMNSKVLAAAAQDEEKQFSSWVKKSRWPGLPGQVADRLYGFLQDDMIAIFAGAWATYSELKKSARETCEHPESTETVALAKHDFTYEIEPQVDVLLNRVKVATIPFQIGITCAVTGLELYLKQGAVYQVTSGSCDCKVEIRCAGKLIWERTVRKLDLPGELHLTKPIVLERMKKREPATVER
jgi:hypothetical protein